MYSRGRSPEGIHITARRVQIHTHKKPMVQLTCTIDQYYNAIIAYWRCTNCLPWLLIVNDDVNLVH